MATIIVGGMVALAMGAAAWKLVDDKRKGKGCCGDCSKCKGCH